MPGKYWNKELEDRLMQLASNGRLSAAEIGEDLGMTRNSVIAKMKRMEIPSKYKKPPSKSKIIKKIMKFKKHNKPDTKVLDHPSFNSPTSKAKRMIDLGVFECRWAVCGDKPSEYLFCGEHADGPYCQDHKELSYSKRN